ncbi:hypothetical protein ACSCBZ_42060 [Streptomyces niveiscabiei]|uniref:hypothetical protein n=1 Tax=Streptomyces niveiscabiei TaxID=164115 RepID=UPI0006EB8D96|nr:hypothetical protein [Streptomyces niveiscabiei]
MSDDSPADPGALTPYFFIMTVQLRDGGTATFANTVNVAPGDSRAKVFDIVRRHVVGEVGHGGFTILFFSLEPNQL